MFSTVDWLLIGACLLLAFLVGAWMMRAAGRGPSGHQGERVCAWLLGGICPFSGMFGIGHLLKLNGMAGATLSLTSAVTFVPLLKLMSGPLATGATGESAG